MAEAQKPSKGGLTRGKAILIAVLGIVLVVILYVQFGSASAKPISESAGNHLPRRTPVLPASAAKPATATATKGPGSGATAATPAIDESRWKSPKLAAVVAYDPFALPAAFPQPAKVKIGDKTGGAEGLIEAAAANDRKKVAEALEKLQMGLEELKQRGVTVIVREGDAYAAMIGDRMLHVGDEINHFTVTAIDPADGVSLERKESQ